jgi:hypothetical protein
VAAGSDFAGKVWCRTDYILQLISLHLLRLLIFGAAQGSLLSALKESWF